MAGSGQGNFEFDNSGRKVNTFGSDQGVNLKNNKAFGGIPTAGGSMGAGGLA